MFGEITGGVAVEQSTMTEKALWLLHLHSRAKRHSAKFVPKVDGISP
jgi:hypothetical protein